MKKMKGIPKVLLLVSLAMIFALSAAGQASAQLTYYYGIDTMFGNPPQWGGVAPAGTWATAEFVDVTGGVELTLNVTNNLSVENIGEFYFNSIMSTSSLAINAQGGGGSSAVISKGDNSYQADGDGLYDLLFKFPPRPGDQDKDKFTAGETVIYDITGAGVSASNFYQLAAPGTGSNGPFYAAAKLQGIPCDTNIQACADEGGTTSAWAAGVVPEPVSSTLFIIGGAVLGGRAYRKRKKK